LPSTDLHILAASGPRDAVELSGVRRVFGERAVLDGIDLTIRRGEFIAVLGPSGTGKTTLLRLLAGLDKADGGRLLVPKTRSVVFQEPRLIPARRVWENVVLGRRGAQARREAAAALEEVGLGAHVDAWPRTLSGGEAQRVALARALVREPGLLLLDEPFAALDALTRIRMHDLVLQLWRRHHPAVVLVTHDVDEAILLADRVLALSNGSWGLDERVEIKSPRDRSDPAFAALRGRLLAELGVRPTIAPLQ
jgi:sulfonate transport system ATP-binding protein